MPLYISVSLTRVPAKMNTLTQIFLLSAVVAVALCGAAPQVEDVAVMEDTAQAVMKMHKLRKYISTVIKQN